jgi:hypothetical protein
MFIGHEAVALVAKRLNPRISLGTLLMAVQFLDLLWPIFLLLGIEHVRIDPGNTAFTPLDFYDYPWTHSLLFSLIWSVLFGLAYHLIRRNTRGAVWLGACVFSHWILDTIVHRADLPLYPGSSVVVGLGLWHSIGGTIALEFPVFAAGVIVYLRSTSAKNWKGHVSFWSFVTLLLVIYFSSIGNPPANESTLAVLALSGWLLVLWGYWIDRTRSASTTGKETASE